MQFLKTFLAVLLGLIVFCLISVFIGIGIVSSMSDEQPILIKEKSILHLKLNSLISEREIKDPLSEISIFADSKTIGLVQLHETIMDAMENENIEGIFLEVEILGAGFAKTEQIRRDLQKFKESGKFVVAYANMYSETAYYLASVADKVFLNPEGFFEFNGLSATPVFFKGLFDKLNIKPQIFRVGEYKGAVEPFIRKDLSEENRFQIKELLGSVNDIIIENIATSRNMPEEEVRKISVKMMARNGDLALELGLVDSLIYRDQLNSYFKEKIGSEEDEDLELITYNNYGKSFSNFVMSDNEIAVIVGEGEIYVNGDQNAISGVRYSEALRKAREDDDVKAVVLRINSQGGQLQAADMIWREVTETVKVKPVIASFSDVAASGGYYMAVAANAIVAEKTTITGSIGIFGILFNLSEFLDSKLGITTDEVSTGEFSGIFNASRPLSEKEKEFIQQSVNKGYNTFISKVADGRGMNIDDLEKLASGRVWSGSQALENGLIDEYGGVFEAIDLAAKKAELEDFKVKYYPKKKTILEELLGDEGLSTQAVKSEMGEYYYTYKQLKDMILNQGIQARMPFELDIK